MLPIVRNVGTPLAAETPAPVNTVTRSAVRSRDASSKTSSLMPPAGYANTAAGSARSEFARAGRGKRRRSRSHRRERIAEPVAAEWGMKIQNQADRNRKGSRGARNCCMES